MINRRLTRSDTNGLIIHFPLFLLRKKFGHLIGQICFWKETKRLLCHLFRRLMDFPNRVKIQMESCIFAIKTLSSQSPENMKNTLNQGTFSNLQPPTFQFAIKLKIRTHLQRMWYQLGELNLVVNLIRRTDEEVQDLIQSQPELHTFNIERPCICFIKTLPIE